jgi:predicted ATPase
MESMSLSIPAPVSSFVGRTQEQAEVADHLTAARLVTLAGPAGVGKTRLALAVAHDAQGRYEHGARLARLGSVSDPARVCQAVASALSVPDDGGHSCMDVLIEHFGTRACLLVLDNCEHLVDACADLAIGLLESCPALVVLATSREPLAVAGERVFRVPPLATPAADIQASPDVLERHPAVQLFMERAVATCPQFSLTRRNASAVSEICRRLDGLPLALELAAARVTVFSPAQIRQHLDRRFELLTGGNRTAHTRHQTLQAALSWSHELLSASEQTVFRRLAVFSGGWNAEAAVSVCADAELSGFELVDVLESLVNQSLVIAEETGTRTRFRFLETIRHYAWERLVETGELADLRYRHASWFLDEAEDAEQALLRGEQQPQLTALEAEHDNLRAALAWALSEEVGGMALRLASALVLFWVTRCHLHEGLDWLDRALDTEYATSGEAPPGLAGKAV